MTEAQFIINNINMYYDGVFNRLQNKNQVLHTQPLLNTAIYICHNQLMQRIGSQ